jgi:hypothetical protein
MVTDENREENRKSTIKGSTLKEFELPLLRRLARVCASELEHVMNFRGLRLLKTAATPL